MKPHLHGDIPPEHKRLVEELLELEAQFDHERLDHSPDVVAKAFVCMAHDYYHIGEDEYGGRLLEKADLACPGYFDNEIKKHIEEDGLYCMLVENLTADILDLIRSVKEGIN